MKLLVVGGGPAGVTAALHAHELGAEVTLVEARRLGGTGLTDGPGPVRPLARAARLVRDARSWDQFGLAGDVPHVDIGAALERSRRVVDYAHEQRRLDDVVRSRGVDVVDEVGPS